MESRELAKYAVIVVKEAKRFIESEGVNKHRLSKYNNETDEAPLTNVKVAFETNAIYDALFSISPSLAYSYKQVKLDILDIGRISWAGTAHEIREIIANLLRHLAPDNSVKQQSWYKLDPSGKVTQVQRARYILQTKNSGSHAIEGAEESINLIDELVSELVRSTYNRASTAAHTYKGLEEVKRILGYFEALVQDLVLTENH